MHVEAMRAALESQHPDRMTSHHPPQELTIYLEYARTILGLRLVLPVMSACKRICWIRLHAWVRLVPFAWENSRNVIVT